MIHGSAGRATSVRPILDGRLVRSGDEVLDASSTISLVVSADKKVIVDTGSSADTKLLREALRAASVRPDEVDMVVNTHLHMDHIGGNSLFQNARFYAHRLESPPLGTIRISDELELLPGVELVLTPGHTAGSISVLVHAERRYAICGDAIPTRANIENHVPPSININPRLALNSMDFLEASADVIVPGHEGQFEVVRRKK
jgi:glyoxylase-like metal-dependent hydrolase (beta-lactamase superfamily II)